MITDAAHTTLAEEFRAGLAEGRLLIQACASCGKANMYPRHHCPFCQSTDLGWRQAVGAGVLHSYTVVRAVPPKGFEDELPYALGVVKLDEGVQLLGRLHPDADGGWNTYACDARVTFEPGPDGAAVAWFSLEARE
jgi:uncharacterized OB-fold protein